MSDFKVTIPFKNEDLETVVEKEYDFITYTNQIHIDLKKILGLVERSFAYFNDGKPKEEWTEESKKRFNEIRHKMLDKANAIYRLPDTLSYKDIPANTMSCSEFISRTLK